MISSPLVQRVQPAWSLSARSHLHQSRLRINQLSCLASLHYVCVFRGLFAWQKMIALVENEMDFPPEYDSSNICPIVAARLPQCHHGVGCLTLPQLPRGALASNAFWLLQCCRGCCAATCAPRDYNSSAVTGWGDGVMRRRRGLRGEVRSSCLRFQYSFLFILHPHHIP